MTMRRQENLVPERRERIRDMLRRKRVVRVDEVCRSLRVSPATARRDLKAIEAEGRIRRVHGGAVSVRTRLEEPMFDDKTSIAAREKRRIAEAAAGLLESGDTVFLDGGSTVLELARLIAERDDITAVTNSLRAAIELAGIGPRLILVGGELRRLSQTMVGSLAQPLLEKMHVDKAFLGTMGFSLDHGLTTTDPEEALTKYQVARRAKVAVLLADSSKLGEVSFAGSGEVEDVDVLVTDTKADKGFLKKVRKRGIRVIVV